MSYTMGSLCTGVAMLDRAVDAVYGPARRMFHAEVAPDPAAVLAVHHPDVPNLGDITGGAPKGCTDEVMRRSAYAKWSTAPRVDLLGAGWPCQVASLAGRQRGSADDRYLWPAVAGAVDALRPAVFVGENVPGLLTVEDGTLFGRVLSDLDDLGYAVRWQTVGACRVGACHHRHRVFIVATRGAVARPSAQPVGWRPDGAGPWVECAADLFGGHAPLRRWPAAGVAVGGSVWARPAQVCGANGLTLFPTPLARDGEGRGEGGPDYWARLRAAGVVKGMPLGAAVTLLPTPTPTPTESDGGGGAGYAQTAQGAPNLRTAVVMAERWAEFGPAVERWELLSGRSAPAPTVVGRRGGPRLSAPFVEFLMGLPGGEVTSYVDNEPAIRILGNGVVWQQAAHALRLLTESAAPNQEWSPLR